MASWRLRALAVAGGIVMLSAAVVTALSVHRIAPDSSAWSVEISVGPRQLTLLACGALSLLLARLVRHRDE